MKMPELARRSLNQRGDGDALLRAQRNVADADLDRIEEGMRPNIPPDFFCVVDGLSLDEEIDLALELRVTGETIVQVGARKFLEDLRAVALVASFHAEPERRVRRKRQDVWQKISQRVHDANRRLAIFDSHMDVQAEDKVGARDELQVFDHLGIARVGIDFLHAPVRKGMGRTGNENEAVLFRQRDHVAAQVEEVFLRDLDIAANSGANLNDGLMHLRLDALFQPQLTLGQHLRRNVRTQIARFRVDCLVLLFYS